MRVSDLPETEIQELLNINNLIDNEIRIANSLKSVSVEKVTEQVNNLLLKTKFICLSLEQARKVNEQLLSQQQQNYLLLETVQNERYHDVLNYFKSIDFNLRYSSLQTQLQSIEIDLNLDSQTLSDAIHFQSTFIHELYEKLESLYNDIQKYNIPLYVIANSLTQQQQSNSFQPSLSIYGSTQQPTNASVGQANAPVSLFGQQAPANSNSVNPFGASFGSNTPAKPSTTSFFGTSAASTPANNTMLGSAQPAGASMFGQNSNLPPPVPSGGNMFGSNLGQPQPQQQSTGFGFGQNTGGFSFGKK